MRLPRRIFQYLIGYVLMALGVVLMKRTNWGNSPVSTLPGAMSDVTPLTMGTATIVIHIICVIIAMIILRKVSLKLILTLGVAFPFGYLIDFGLWLFDPEYLNVFVKIILCVIGAASMGLAVVMIVGVDLMLLAPDELGHVISQVFGPKLSTVKMCSDATYMILALIIDLVVTHSIHSVGIATVISVLLCGRFVGIFGKIFPKLKMEPLWKMPESVKK